MVAGSLVLGACGSDKEDPGLKYPTYADFCAARAEAECPKELTQACSSKTDHCQEKRTSLCQARKPSSAAYRPEVAEKCLSAVTNAYKDSRNKVLTSKQLLAIEEACALMWGGNAESGEECEHNYHCNLKGDDALRCVIKPGDEKGKCYVPSVKGPAQKCSGPDEVCQAGHYCTAADRICAEANGVTDPCSDKVRCLEDLACVDGTCTKFAEDDECSSHAECSTDLMCFPVRQVNKCRLAVDLTPNDPVCSCFDTGSDDPICATF